MDKYPDDNPKTLLGVTKVPMHLVPPSAKIALACAFADGAKKYGPYNWREKTVSASIYIAAAQRHMDAWWDGEELSQDAMVHHIDHAMACLAIIKDAMSIGMLNDDRPRLGAATSLQYEYSENKSYAEQEQSMGGSSQVNWQHPKVTIEPRRGPVLSVPSWTPLDANLGYPESDVRPVKPKIVCTYYDTQSSVHEYHYSDGSIVRV